MILIPIIAIIIGAAIGMVTKVPVSSEMAQYLAVACLAGLDTVCGGIRSGIEGKFSADVFLSGFVSNVVIASFIAWLGDKIYLNLFLAIALVFGKRILDNLSLIRRFMLTKWKDSRERNRLKEMVQASQSEASQP